MRVPVIATARVEWRTISGVDFQVIAPYVMVAKPDRYRAVWVWLRKEQGKWHAHVTAAGAPAGRPVATDRSALGALAVAMDLPVWSQHVQLTPVLVTKIEEWSYPEPEEVSAPPRVLP